MCFVYFSIAGMGCGGFPGPGVEHHMLVNPMKDLIHTSASGHSQRMFDHFKDKFSVSTAMKENIRKGSTLLFIISGETNILY